MIYAPENEHDNVVYNAAIHPDIIGQDRNLEYDLVVEEDDGEQFLSTEIFDDVEDLESDNEFEFSVHAVRL